MRRATKRRMRLFLWLVLAGALIGTAYGSVIGRMFRETGLIGGSIGAIDGAAITVPIAAIEIFALRTRWGRAVQHAPFLVTFGLKWLAYGVLISIINLWSLGVFLLGLVALAAPLPVAVALWSVAFSFAVAFAFLRLSGQSDRRSTHPRTYRIRALSSASPRGPILLVC